MGDQNRPNIFERIRGKRMSDIVLPPETTPDPRLKGSTAAEAIAEAAKNWKKLQENEILNPRKK